MAYLSRTAPFDIVNNSWGSTYPYSSTPTSSNADMFQTAAENGRGGLGTIIVKSAGNSRDTYGYQHAQVAWNNIDRIA